MLLDDHLGYRAYPSSSIRQLLVFALHARLAFADRCWLPMQVHAGGCLPEQMDG